GKTMKLRRHLSASAEHSRNSDLLQRHLLAERLEQLRSREQAANVVVCAQQRHALFDDVLLVLLGHLRLAHLQQLNDPARIEVDHQTDPAATFREMLDRETQATWSSWTKRKPIGSFRKELFRQRVAKRFVVEAEVFDIYARLRHARAAAGFKRVNRTIRVTLRHPATHWTTAQPLVLEKTEARKVVVSLNFFKRIPGKIFGV